MSVAPGNNLGSYEIVSSLGAGTMERCTALGQCLVSRVTGKVQHQNELPFTRLLFWCFSPHSITTFLLRFGFFALAEGFERAYQISG